MTLENTLRQQLNKSESGGFHVSLGDWTLTLVTERQDSLSCAVKELTLEKAGATREELRPWAERLAASATGLMERLRLIELDDAQAKALLRSDAPARKDGKAFYYELVLSRGDRSTASLRRFAGQHGEKREAVAFTLTHDAIVKLVEDIVGGN